MIVDRPHVAIFGRMNVGKSTIMNILLGQDLSIVSPQAGTTTDPVKKVIEILGLGPTVFIDTAGVDDRSVLGEKRIQRTINVMESVNMAIIVFDGNTFGEFEQSLVQSLAARKIPYFFIHSKNDLQPLTITILGADIVQTSLQRPNKDAILEAIKKNLPSNLLTKANIFEGLVKEGDSVLLVVPQDASAPEGRLILPQVQAIRTLIDLNVAVTCTSGKNLGVVLAKIKPSLVVTDSQIFDSVSAIVPASTPLTSFSILFSRIKGDFDLMLKGAQKIRELQDNDNILIMESCTHTVHNCEDIGRNKIPKMLKMQTGKKLNFTFVSGLDTLPSNLKTFALAVQCGGCMITRTQVLNRIYKVSGAGISITNYGMLIACCTGILDRATEMLKK